MTVGLIWAQSASGVIGRAGAIPWRLPEDLAHFKNLTLGHTVVMGRRTWESLPARVRPLPGRRNVVLTRQADYMAQGAHVMSSLDEALSGDDVWVIGGAEIYVLALPHAARCEVTEVDCVCRGRTTMRWRRCSTKDGWPRTMTGGSVTAVCATGSAATSGYGRPDGGSGAPGRGRGPGLRRGHTARCGQQGSRQATDFENPSAAAGFGVSGGARTLRPGVQPARWVQPRHPGQGRVESQRAVPAASCRILGARGGADVGRRLAAAAVADARVPARAVEHRRREEQPAARRATSSPPSPNSGRPRRGRSRRTWPPSRVARRVRGGVAATPSGSPRRCSRPEC